MSSEYLRAEKLPGYRYCRSPRGVTQSFLMRLGVRRVRRSFSRGFALSEDLTPSRRSYSIDVASQQFFRSSRFHPWLATVVQYSASWTMSEMYYRRMALRTSANLGRCSPFLGAGAVVHGLSGRISRYVRGLFQARNNLSLLVLSGTNRLERIFGTNWRGGKNMPKRLLS